MGIWATSFSQKTKSNPLISLPSHTETFKIHFLTLVLTCLTGEKYFLGKMGESKHTQKKTQTFRVFH